MSDGYVLVLDAGSSRARCHAFDRGGKIVGSASREWRYTDDTGRPSISRAFDPKSLWSIFPELIGDCIQIARITPGQVCAVSATSQRQAVVALDGSRRVLYAGPNLDLRAVFEGAAIDEEMRDRVYRTTGHLPSFLFAPAKLRWLQAHLPEVYGEIEFVVTLADWLRLRLTGVLASETTLAAEAGLLDIHRRSWCGGLLADLGLAVNEVPLVDAGAIGGEVGAAASAETGIPRGTPVAVAPADTQCGLLGLGAAEEYQVGLVAGWSAPLQMITPQPVLSPEARTWAGCFPGGDKWVLESSQGDVGNSYRWLGETLFGQGREPFLEMDALAKESAVGADGVVMLLGAQTMDVSRVGMSMGGILYPTPLTFSEIGGSQVVRACLEAIAYGAVSNLRQAEEVAGQPAKNVALGGGMVRTRTWPRIVADVLNDELLVSPTPEVTALGAYLCASKALGRFDSIEEAAESVRPRLRRLEPDPVRAAEYRELHERWAELSARLQGLDL